MSMLEWIQAYCRGRTLILFGNGTTNYTPNTDEIIVRMNYGTEGGYTDIWVNNICQGTHIHRQLFNDEIKYILRLNGEMGGKRFTLNYPKDHSIVERTYWWNAEEWLEMSESLNSPRPLTGTIAVYWFLKYTKPTQMKVTGMDFFEDSKNIYTNTDLTGVHNAALDKEYFKSIEGEVTYV